MADFDMNLVLLGLDKAGEVFNIDEGAASGIGINLDDPYDARAIKERINDVFGFKYNVKTWIDVNRHLFEALFLEKWGLFIVLSLMVIVASFNIISTLIVTVTSKIHDIGILQSIGVPKRSIRKIFTKQGILIGLMGTFMGFGCWVRVMLHP